MDIGDIVEKDVNDDEVTAPEIPRARPTSRFKSWKTKQSLPTAPAPSVSKPQPPLSDEEQIHLENIKKLAGMSQQEIASEREQIMNSFDPNILAALLRRAELKEDEGSNNKPREESKNEKVSNIQPTKGLTNEKVSNTQPTKVNIEKVASEEKNESPNDTHFLKPKTFTADNEESFLEEMHQKYFPDLQVEESKLAWMKPVSEEEDKEYHPLNDSLAPSELRFDFNGTLVTPRMSRDIPTTAGLHHHGDAPSAAGYTVLELAHLARSSNMSQRCLAIRTLGRVIYRVRNGKFGAEISAALSGLLEQSRVKETLLESEKSRVVAEVAYAQEALWIWNSSNVRGAV